MALDELEKNLLESIDEKEVIALAKELIKIPSLTGEETPVAEFLAEYLGDRGFQIEMQEVEPGRFQPLATLKGTRSGTSLLFNGHMDIDPLARDLKSPFEPVVKDGLIYGAGICNMKAGVTAMVAASAAIAEADLELEGDLFCNPVVGELQGGVGTVHSIKNGPRPDAVVVTEPTNLRLLLKHTGVLGIAITTLGLSDHISRREGTIDAIKKMWKIQQALYEMDEKKKWTYEFDPDLPKLPMMNLGSIIGGRGRNYELRGAYDIPDLCTILVNARLNSSQSIETAKKDFTALLEKLKEEDQEIEYQIQFPPLPFGSSKFYMPPVNIPEDEYIVRTISNCHERVTGLSPVKITNEAGDLVVYAGDDDAHYWGIGVPAFCYGPGCMRKLDPKLGHHPPVPVEHIVICTKVLALAALNICTKTREEYNRLRPKR